ncbi:MAG: helicase C-terminal domain-containing protein, partial [Halobacteriaceae archaeon]
SRVVQAVEGRDRMEAGSDVDLDALRGVVRQADVTPAELDRVRQFVRALREELDRRVSRYLEREHPEWRADPADLSDAEIPLRDPDEPEVDELSEWATEEGWEDCWTLAESSCAVAARALDAADEEDLQYAATGVGRTLAAWGRADHEQHFREIVLERTWDQSHAGDSWRRVYNARLDIHHCVPGDVIGDRLSSFGGGVLMSATLQPLSVFAETTGLERLRAAGRPVESRTYGLSFPDRNRASFAVDAPKYTYENRGEPGSDSQTRQTHLDAVVEVARGPGNVLVGMPNYAEAGWMADALEQRIEKPVLLDESSADEVTESLKESFFEGSGKVLVTSLRGTLTEGVDYQGDRLHAAVVCGVPLVNTASPRIRAVRTAYDRVFDGNGFEYALTVPAVRKARQAIGRVVRGPEEVGVRVLVDARYARSSWDSVAGYLPDGEFQSVSPEFLRAGLDRFWDRHDP